MPMSHGVGHTEKCSNAVNQRSTGADGDQRIHVGAAVPEGF